MIANVTKNTLEYNYIHIITKNSIVKLLITIADGGVKRMF